jgi:hypothetical protein
MDQFVLMTETINHSAAKAIHKELYSRGKVTAMLNKASETNLTNLQQLLSRLAIIRAQTPKSKMIMTAHIQMCNNWRLLHAQLCNRQSNEEVSQKWKKIDDDLSAASPMCEKKKRYSCFEGSRNKTWMTIYKALVEYKNKHGDCRVPKRYADDKPF